MQKLVDNCFCIEALYAPVTRHTSKRKTKRNKGIPGISEDAAALGVTRFHLSAVLHNRRASGILSKRHAALKAEREAATGKPANSTES